MLACAGVTVGRSIDAANQPIYCDFRLGLIESNCSMLGRRARSPTHAGRGLPIALVDRAQCPRIRCCPRHLIDEIINPSVTSGSAPLGGSITPTAGGAPSEVSDTGRENAVTNHVAVVDKRD